MMNYYVGVEDTCFDNIKTKEDVYEVLDALHSKTMEDCGAIDDTTATSEALEAMEKILNFAGYECENIETKQ